MNLNCEVGDLAIVISDEPGCEDNIGRIAKVMEPATISGSSQAWWRIEPADRQPWTCIKPIEGGKWFEVFQASEVIYIEDRCLRPLRNTRSQTRQTLDTTSQKSSATD